jgi:hypothetical protein
MNVKVLGREVEEWHREGGKINSRVRMRKWKAR